MIESGGQSSGETETFNINNNTSNNNNPSNDVVFNEDNFKPENKILFNTKKINKVDEKLAKLLGN